MQRVLLAVIVAAVAVVVSGSAVASGSQPTADYRFEKSPASSVAGAPDLTTLGPGTNAYKKETVTSGKRLVLTFPKDNGVQLTPTTGLIANDVYTIVVQFRFANVDGFRRIVDFKNGTQDSGVYDINGNLQLWPSPAGGGGLQPNVYAQVVFTRDASGMFTGYVNGVQQLQVDDSVNQYGVVDSSNTLRFFRDNDSGGVSGEDSAGAVARIELFNSALSAAEVAALPTAPPKPTLTVSPKSGPSGTFTTFTGNNFGPSEAVKIIRTDALDPGCNDTTGILTSTDASGHFVEGPIAFGDSCAAGTTIKFTATGMTSGLKKAASFKVTS